MSSFYIVCAPTLAPIGDSISSFEAWLVRRFPHARVTERDVSDFGALGWSLVQDEPARWLDGTINQERTAISLKGDLDLVCEAAVAAVELFPGDADVILVNSSQGIVFDVRRLADPRRLAEAVSADDETHTWHDPATRDDQSPNPVARTE